MTNPNNIKVNYLNNRELLSEINKSKASFSYFVDKKYANYDCIIEKLEQINHNTIIKALEEKKRKIELEARAKKQPIPENLEFTPYDLVFRVMTHEHIPVDPERALKARSSKDTKVKTNFPAFKHYIIESFEEKNNKYQNIQLKEVGRSHWKGGLHNGHFCMDHGRITNRLALMFMTLVNRYGQRSNWRGYTYLDEMKSQALLQLSQVGLQFDESRSENPFAYYTAIITTSFTRILNLEKRNQNLRDDMLIKQGQQPSNTKQVDHQLMEYFAEELARKLYKEGVSEEEVDSLVEDEYEKNSNKISLKPEEFKQIVMEHFKHFVNNADHIVSHVDQYK